MIGHRVHNWQTSRTSGTGEAPRGRLGFVLALLALLVVAAWSYCPVMSGLVHAWEGSDDYSAGQLVPLVAVFLVWHERKRIRECPLVPCWRGGVALLLLAEAASIYLFLAGAHPSLERYLIVVALASLVLLVAGRQVFRRVLWILLFLLLMVPLPGRIHDLIGAPLQTVATTGSVFLLEAFGISVSQQGNVVVLGGVTPLAVAEACSGLRMLMAFIIVAAFIAYMIKRPRWMKGVLLASSIPVAVVCNMARIFATAILMLYVSTEMAQKFFHDFAGYVMMPAAVMLLFGEIWLMDRIIVPDGEGRTKPAAGKAKPARRVRERPGRNVADWA
jgi:exosortase